MNPLQNNYSELTNRTPDNRQSNFNNMNRFNCEDGSSGKPQGDLKQKNQSYNNQNQNNNVSKKAILICDYMLKNLRPD